jgi:sugar phosphate isomerase/epimerase
MNKVLCSTGTIIGGANDFNYKLIPEYAKNIKCDGFEFMMEPMWNNEEKINEIVSYLLPFDLNFYTMHTDKDIGYYISKNEPGDIDGALQIFELECRAASELGVKLLVLHLWGGTPSDKHIDVNIKMCGDLMKIAEKYNLILTVENVVCNTYNSLIHMKNLYETYGNNIKFTIDVRHAEFHRILKETCESDYLWENNLAIHFHIADYRGDYMDWSKLRPVLPPGEGDIDFNYLSAFLKKIDFKGSFTLEAAGARTESGIDFKILNKRLDFIYNLMR